MTFVAAALLAVGCGGGAAGTASSSSDDSQPPSNGDQPNGAADQARSSPDQAASSPDQAPGGPAASPGGTGDLGALCEQVCNTVASLGEHCASLKAGDFDFSKACSGPTRCQVPAGTKCQTEIAALFGCFLNNLDLVCGGAQSERDAPAACEDAVTRFVACAAEQNSGGSCTSAGDCECANACDKCKCKADTDVEELAACLEPGAPCAP